jgi:hypothetical protein
MRFKRFSARVCAVFALAAASAATAFGQSPLPDESIAGPLTRPSVSEAPFSADATTTVHATLGDGTRLDQTTTERFYRDSDGRVRVERSMDGLRAPVTMAERHIRTVIAREPDLRGVFTLDAQTRTARAAARDLQGMTAGGGRGLAVPVGGARFLVFERALDLLSTDPAAFADVRDEPLGTRQIAGVAATGRRVTIVVPPGYHGHDQAIEMVDERWESAELHLLIQSRHSDSRGTIEYRLWNIQRTEPPPNLFEIPVEYTVDYTPTRNDPWLSFANAESPRAGAYIAGKSRR